jgi:transcriptional regulator with XRE-family HTH domain
MSGIFELSAASRTTAGGSANLGKSSFLFVGAFLLAMSAGSPATASSYPTAEVPVERTGASPNGRLRYARTLSTAGSVLEIRRLSGLTWEELASLFGVSRRSVHHWASGKAVSAANEDLIRKVLTLVRSYNRGDARTTRALLMETDASGASPFALIRAGAIDDVRAVAPPSPSALQRARGPYQTAPRPLPPHVLLDGINDSRPSVPTKPRLARVHRVPKATGG